MTAITAHRVLNVTALGIPVHRLSGPALLGESGTQMLVLVSGEDGEPAEHLAERSCASMSERSES